jgi:hypothetical protein
MTMFSSKNIFEFEPKFPGADHNEPCLRRILFEHYMVCLEGLENAAYKAKMGTDDYMGQVLEAYFGISRGD